MRILKNILLNTGWNILKHADIYFDNQIQMIDYRSEEIVWSDINTRSKFDNYILKTRIPIYPEDAEWIEGNYNIAIPGAIDPHVHFDTPGFETHDTFDEASTAAAYGGTTTIVDMPCTSLPPVTNQKNFLEKYEAVKNRSLVDFAFWGGVSGNDIHDKTLVEKQIRELDNAGVSSFKVYVISGMQSFTDLTYEQIKLAAKEIVKTGKPMGVHAEDKNLVISTREKFQSDNKNTWKEYCESRSVKAEVVAVNKMIEIAEETGCRIHIVHLSSGAALKQIENAQSRGIHISAETCPHYLHFSQKDFDNPDISNFLKTAPPVKFEEDSEYLWKGLKKNTLQFLTTDHAGCVAKEGKQNKNFWKVYGGIPGVQHRVQFLFSEGFLKNRLSLEDTIKHVSTNAAEFFNIPNKGKIEPGYDADFAIINPWKSEIIKGKDLKSKGKYSPFENLKFRSVIEQTLLRGSIIMNNAGNVEKNVGYGKLIKIN